MAYCGQCGTYVGGAFCGKCGARGSQPDVDVASTVVSPHPPTELIASVVGQEPAEAYASQATVPLVIPEPDPRSVKAPPAVGAWAASPAAQQPFQLPQSESAPFQPQPFQPPLLQPELPARRRTAGLVAAITVGVLVLAGGGYAAAKLTILKDSAASSASTQVGADGGAQNNPAPSAKALPSSAPSPVAVPITSTPTPTPIVDPAVAAKAQLEALVAKDALLPTVRGQWVAQLSSKSEGMVDTTLQPGPFTVPDILAEHLRLRSNPSYGSVVRLLHLGDWGGLATPASPMWVTVADINAGSSAEVTTWCEAHFSQRGKALENVCMAAQLTPNPG